MRKPQYSNKNTEKTRYITYEQASERYQLGRSSLIKIANECGAIRKIGRSVRLNLDVMDEAIESYV